MSYLVLARKWRPMRFEDLVGQDHVARTLGNAIKSGRVAHAFLFTGVRGVGKTTSARILAKALNCMAEGSPTTTPCLKCPACLEITQGTDIDVREIDGASYNGVDEVRKLQDSIPYRPNRDRFKIFIVDEVHMLSQSAWNAFLKTLEEPPPHVKFIFATTEVHKVPVTILSRVQRFDFKLISAQTIATRLTRVLEAEGIQTDEAALSVIAREAAGSMRDAMSLLDQVIAWGGESLKGEDVARVLGVASHAVLYELARAVVAGDAAKCLSVVAQVSDLGYDIPHVVRDTLLLFRNLVVAKISPEPLTLLDLPAEEARDVIELARSSDADDLVRLHQAIASAFDDVVKSGQPRAAFEMLLVRVARRPPLVPLDTLIHRIAQLERRLAGAPTPPRGAPNRPPAAPAQEPSPLSPAPRAREARPARETKPVEASDDSGEPPPVAAPSPAASLGGGGPRRAEAPEPPTDLGEFFRNVVGHIAAERAELAAKLEHAVILELTADTLLLGWAPDSLFGKLVATPESNALIERAARSILGRAVRVQHEHDSARAAGKKTLSLLSAEERERKTREAYETARRHPRIAEAVEILGARLKDLKLAKTP